MPKDKSHGGQNGDIVGRDHEEARSLLSDPVNDEDDESHPSPLRPSIPLNTQRQSSFSRLSPHDAPRTPRTANRVRFDLEERIISENAQNGHSQASSEETDDFTEEEDYMSNQVASSRRSSTGQRAPLLTDVEAPSVTVASADVGFHAEDLLENARPKSGMRSAFMNMANSIM